MIIVRFFPNGEFSHGVDTSAKRPDREYPSQEISPVALDKGMRDAYLSWYEKFPIDRRDWNLHPIGSQYDSENLDKYTLRKSSENSCELEWSDSSGQLHTTVCTENIVTICYQRKLSPLVYLSLESCESPPSRKKLQSMTKSMARNIRQGVFLLERESGSKDVLSFLTLTLPNISKDSLEICCEKWDYMVKRLLDWLRVRLEAGGIRFEYVYCTEIQTKRLQLRSEYAPHLHIVFRGRIGHQSPWIIGPKQIRKAWADCISSLVAESFCPDALENLQRIKYSAARYLSKYLSKGKNIIPQETGENAISALHTQWGGMARHLARAIRKSTIILGRDGASVQLAFYLVGQLEKLLGYGCLRYYKKGFIALGTDLSTGMEYGLHIGCGCLCTPTHDGGYDSLMECFIASLVSN